LRLTSIFTRFTRRRGDEPWGSPAALRGCGLFARAPRIANGRERDAGPSDSDEMTIEEDQLADIGETGTIVDAREAAENAGLIYVTDTGPGIARQPYRGKFRYRDAKGAVISDERTLKRIASLAIPPAYTDVWICPKANGHIQATGRDAKGRKQYRYHARFREVRDSTKYEHMLDFAKALPAVRDRIDADLKKRGLPREKVLAAVVHLLETTMIRVGNADYAKQNNSFGLTTLQDRHVAIEGAELRFNFKGKSGKQWKLKLKDRRIAKIVKASQDLPGQHLFQYIGDDGAQYEVTSNDINAYLKEISGTDITAKDFRTWNGTVLAALALAEYEKVDSQAAAKRNVRAAIEAVASRLGNTPTVCRKCYIHPEVFESYLSDELVLEARDAVEKELREEVSRLRPEEAVVLAFLQRRLADKTKIPAP
jgi:DNA topoisomerase I